MRSAFPSVLLLLLPISKMKKINLAAAGQPRNSSSPDDFKTDFSSSKIRKDSSDGIPFPIPGIGSPLKGIKAAGVGIGTLFRFSNILRKGNSIAEKASKLLSSLKEFTGATVGNIALLDGDELHFICGTGQKIDDLEGKGLTYSYDSLWQVLSSGDIFIGISSKTALPSRSSELFSLIAGDLPAFVIIPLVTAASSLGLIFLGFENPPPNLSEMTEFFRAISNMVGNAFSQEISAQTIENITGGRTRQLETLYKIISIVNQSDDLPEAFCQALDEILKTTGFSMGAVFLVDDIEEKVNLIASVNLPPKLNSLLKKLPLATSLEGQVIKEADSVDTIITEAMFEGRHHDLILPVSFHGLPMRIQGRTIGVISLLGIPGHNLTVDQKTLLGSIADHLGMIIENHRLRKNAERAAVIEERARLAREFHDSVTQSLYSASLLNAAAREMLKNGNYKELEANLERLDKATQSSLKEMRLLVYELRSPALDEGGVLEAVRRRLSAVEMRAGVETSLEVKNYRQMEVREEEELFRIAMEGLNNSLKYSNASKIMISFDIENQNVVLTIEDNGIGFDPQDANVRGGFGIKTMRERSEKLGGCLQIDSAPGKGTRLSACIPCREIDKISTYHPPV